MNERLSTVVGVGAAVAIVVCGLVVGAPPVEASGPSSPRVLGAPERAVAGSQEVSLGDGLEIWGRPSQQSAFWTPDDPQTVVRTYLDAWDAAGLKTNTKTIDKVSNVSALEESTGLLRTVTVIDGEGPENLVLPGVTDVRALPDPTPTGSPVPIPATAAGYVAHSADDRTSVSYSASFLVALAPDRVLRFYERELTPAQYLQTPREASLGAEAAEWKRGPELVSIVATPLGKDEKSTSFVVVTHTRALVEDGE